MGRTSRILVTQGAGPDLRLLWAKRTQGARHGFHDLPIAALEDGDEAHDLAAARALFVDAGLVALEGRGLQSSHDDPLWHAYRGSVGRGDETLEARLAPHVPDIARYTRVPAIRDDAQVFRLHLAEDEALTEPPPIEGGVDPEWITAGEALARFGRGEAMLSAEVHAALVWLETGEALEPWRAHEVAGGWMVVPLESPTLPPATHTNCVLVGTGAFIVIDPGSEDPTELGRLFEIIDQRQARGETLKAICLTHHHIDHICGIAAVQARYGKVLPVWAHAETAACMGRGTRVAKKLRDGEVLRLGEVEVECVWTPGHAPGHLMFLERATGVAAGGDLVASEGTIVVRPPEGSMGDYMASLRRAKTLGLRVLYPSHGEALVAPERIFDMYLAHRQAREDQVLEALRARGAEEVTALGLVGDVYEDVPKAVWPIAAFSLQAHLEHLVELGLATQDGVTFTATRNPQ